MSVSHVTQILPLTGPLRGTVRVPGDKSISHRAVLFAAMAEGTSHVCGILDSEDVRSSIKVVEQLGAQVSLETEPDGNLVGSITGWGATGPHKPAGPLDCGNSGTTARLLMGMLASWDISVEITGDESLKRRPMGRITTPLMQMGVCFEFNGSETLPLTEVGTPALHAITYDTPVASAQLKTALLLAGAYARGTTTVHEPVPSRNHTELMLPAFGVPITAADCTASVTGPRVLQTAEIEVPGDPSSAAFLVCAALLKPESSLQVQKVSLNRARIGFLRVLERMGANVSVCHGIEAGKELYGAIEACYTQHLHGCEVPSEEIPALIDEVPVLALVAAHAHGVSVFHEVGELRVKETDRLAAIVEGLCHLEINAYTKGNDLYIEGNPCLRTPPGLIFNSQGDHRLAMTWALVGLVGSAPVQVKNFNAVTISYPRFLDDIERLAR